MAMRSVRKEGRKVTVEMAKCQYGIDNKAELD